MPRFTIAIFLMVLISSCEQDNVQFTEPQPLDKNELNKFPIRLRGTYRSNGDNTFLTISKYSMVEWVNYQLRTHKDSLNIDIDTLKTVEISDQHFQILDGKYNLELEYDEDSVTMDYSYKDTVFSISNTNVLKRFKGQYFLNNKLSENKWVVKLVSLRSDSLSFSRIKAPSEISDLEEFTEVNDVKTEDSEFLRYQINPTKAELKQLMKHSFSESNKYVKIK